MKMEDPPKKKEEAKTDKKINQFDGLIHNADGTKDFPDGGKVGGVNLYPQRNTDVQLENGDFIHDFQVNRK